MTNLSNKRVLITGASGGIGQAISHAFVRSGANVILSGSNATKLEAFANEINAQSIVCDLSQPEQSKSLFKNAEEQFGAIDILINNAGITKDKLFMMMNDKDFYEVLEVNLMATFRLMKEAVKSMMKRSHGRIINIASVVGFTGNAGQANYCASKAALTGLTKSVALEVASRHITVNCVAPGLIASDMTAKIPEKIKDRLISLIPMNRMGVGEDVAACCTFLASDAAGYMTGQTLHPNGGMFMH